MTPAECHLGMRVRVSTTQGRIWEVRSIEGNWAELQHEDGARCQITVSSLVAVDPPEAQPLPVADGAEPTWQERVWAEVLSSPPQTPSRRAPSLLCWAAIVVVGSFIGFHVWAAIAFGRSTTGLDPAGAAVAIVSSGAGWSAWFVTALWLVWRSKQ